MVNAKTNKFLNLNARSVTYKSVVPVNKQMSAPLRTVCTKEKSVYTEIMSYECNHSSKSKTNMSGRLHTGSKNSRPTSFPVSVRGTLEKQLFDRVENTSTDISLPIKNEKWTSMTDTEQNRWIIKYLNSIKNEIIAVYKMIVDFRKGEVIKEELFEVSSILSLIDIHPYDESKILSIRMKSNYLTTAIQLKELCQRYKEVTLEHEQCKNTIESQLRQLNKEKHEKETQTDGIKVEELEDMLKNVSSENTLLQSEFDVSKVSLACLKRDLEDKNNKMSTISEENSLLISKIEILTKTVNDTEKVNLGNDERITNLNQEKNKYKYDLNAALREKDYVSEENIVLKNKCSEMSSLILKLKSEADEKRSDFVHNSLQMSELTDKINNKTNQIKNMEEIISKHEELNEQYIQENRDQINIISNLETNIAELKNELNSWETRAGCWINTYVRDEYDSKIENLLKEKQVLTIKNKQLMEMHNCIEKEKSDQMDDYDQIVTAKQQMINQLEGLNKLMRKIHNTNNGDERSIQTLIDDFVFKFDNTRQLEQNLEKLIRENSRLRTLVNECKQRLNKQIID